MNQSQKPTNSLFEGRHAHCLSIRQCKVSLSLLALVVYDRPGCEQQYIM